MRPLKLTISAFGPFADKIQIDMDKLGTKGIYLITGDTGAGKTTIFDALTYALYGEASGSMREPRMMRSKYATPETPTEVELVFEYSGKTYTVRRNPEYERPAKKGGGTTLQRAEAELIFDDGRVINKIKDVDAAVKEIMGIDCGQFLSVAMLAQGDFRKLITASTEKRKEIFRKIFNTSLYRSIQEKLKADLSETAKEYEKLTESIRQYIENVSCGEDSVFCNQVNKDDFDKLSVDETIEIINKITEEDNLKFNELKKSFEDNDAEILKITENLKNAEKQAELKKSEKLLSENTALLKNLEQALTGAKKYEPEIAEINNKIAVEKNLLTQYDEAGRIASETEKTKNELILLKKKYDKLSAEYTETCEKIRACESNTETLADAETQHEVLKNSLDRSEAELSELDAEKNSILSYINTIDNWHKKQSEYLAAANMADELGKIHMQKSRAFFDAQAGILAQKLESGKPCPVCGSKTHPHPAETPASAPSEKEVEAAKAKHEKQLKVSSQLSTETASLKGKADEILNRLVAKDNALYANADLALILPEIDKKYELIKSKISDTKVQLEITKNNILKKQKIQAQLSELKKTEKLLSAEIASSGSSVSLLEGEAKEKEKALLSVRNKLRFQSKNEAAEYIKQLENQAADLQERITSFQVKYDTCKEDVNKLQGNIAVLKNILKNTDNIDCDAEKQRLSEKLIIKNNLNNMQNSVWARLEQNRKLLQNIKSRAEQLDGIRRQYIMQSELSDTANGTVAGKEKIMLETYVQMMYFDKILGRANARLMVMTEGQYELRRREEMTNLKSQSGLELDVTDHYNGTVRNAETLSGGECFKAALSLALGLADEIQASAGGIKLDTMFVDEGFGSLDENSLNLAISALDKITEGNRLVGIISHVPELKARIDKQIVVKKDKAGGSRAELVC